MNDTYKIREETIPIATTGRRFKNFDEARQWAKSNIIGTYINRNTGEELNISKTAIDKYLSSSAVLKSIDKDAHLSVITILPTLIISAVLKETKQDRENNRDIKAIRRYYNFIVYENTTFTVKITVKAYPFGNNKAYSYEVMK